MHHGPPGCDDPHLYVASYPGQKFPGAEFVSDFSKTGNELIQVGTPRRIFADHVVDEWLHEVYLRKKSNKFFIRIGGS